MQQNFNLEKKIDLIIRNNVNMLKYCEFLEILNYNNDINNEIYIRNYRFYIQKFMSNKKIDLSIRFSQNRLLREYNISTYGKPIL